MNEVALLREATPRTTMKYAPTGDFILALDGLRGVAVILVLFRHAAEPVRRACDCALFPVIGLDLGNLMVNGWIGVDLFFALSGFLITRNVLLFEERGRLFSWRSYLKRRSARSLPAYLAVLFLIVAGMIPLYRIDPADLLYRIGYHLLFLQDYLRSDIIVAYWSLGVEVKFYLVIPLLLGVALGTKSVRLRWGLVLLFAMIGPLSRGLTTIIYEGDMTYAEFFPLLRSPFHMSLDGLGAGMLAALIEQRYRKQNAMFPPWLAQVLILGGSTIVFSLMISHTMLLRITLWDQIFQPVVMAAAFSAIILGSSMKRGSNIILTSRPLVFVGRISYPLYLIHMALIPLSWAISGATRADGSAALMLFLPVFFTLSIAMATLLHLSVERPFFAHRGAPKFRLSGYRTR